MRPISYALICMGFMLAAAAEGFCIGLLLFVVVKALFFPGADFIGIGIVAILIVVSCTLLSALFQFPFLWNKARPDLANTRIDGNSA